MTYFLLSEGGIQFQSVLNNLVYVTWDTPQLTSQKLTETTESPELHFFFTVSPMNKIDRGYNEKKIDNEKRDREMKLSTYQKQ